MLEFLKKALVLIKDIALAILLGAFFLLVWIPFVGFFSGIVGLLVGFILSSGLRACLSSPYLLAAALSFALFFHLFPIFYALVRLKNIFVRNFRILRSEIPEKRFSALGLFRETIQVVGGRLPSFLIFFLAAAVIGFFFLPTKSKSRPKFWDNLDFISVFVCVLFVIAAIYYSLCESKYAPFTDFGKRLDAQFVEFAAKLKTFFSFRAVETETEVARQKHFDRAPWLALLGLFKGLIAGLAVGISLTFIIFYPFWVLGLTAFFSLFHLYDLRQMFREREWLGFSGRLVFLMAISSYLAGFFCLAVFGLPTLFAVFIIVGVPLGMIGGLIWIWMEEYFPASRPVLAIDQIARGAYKLGVFWKEK